jgi:CHASE2 domain-containing sensor protein
MNTPGEQILPNGLPHAMCVDNTPKVGVLASGVIPLSSQTMKSFASCFIFAAVAEALTYRAAAREYSPVILAFLAGVWGFGSLVLAWFEPRPRFVYFGSVALSTPCISYSMLEYGLLEMGGFLHPLCAGVYALPFHYLFKRSRARRQQPFI